MERVYLGVGSNLGDRSRHLEKAKALLAKIPMTQFLRSSSVIETDPVGGPPQGKYLNAVWEIDSALAPREFKDHLLEIEAELGRRRSGLNMPREIDLDILFFGARVIDERNLKIPHPRLRERRFVLEPLAELIPGLMHPVLKKTVAELLGKISL